MDTALQEGTEFLIKEAHLLDTQQWDEWLALFYEDCEYWMPAWKAEHQPTSNPKTELSLIYYGKRWGLEDRVTRVRSGLSVASTPLPRTQHSITNVRVEPLDGERSMKVFSNWTVNQFNPKKRNVSLFFGRYEHELARDDGTWRIRRKKIFLLNDYMPAMLDFYSI